jgi:hypothetical protein
MAQRRMFSKRITSSTRFLKMPLSTQALYFHLGLNADDDGVVEAFVIMNQLGATEDELRILVAKGFVTILNEDLVSYINDWQENNHIRSDRKIDSIYKPLLLQVLPDADLQVSRERADRVPKTAGTSHGQPTDNQGTAQVRLGKVRLGKDSKENKARTRKRVYALSSNEYRLANELWQKVKEHNSEAKSPNLQHWADDIRKMHELDKRPYDKIERMVAWSQQDDFWSGNVLSAAKLRKHYDQMATQANMAARSKRHSRYGKQPVIEETPKWQQPDYEAPKRELDADEAAALQNKLASLHQAQKAPMNGAKTESAGANDPFASLGKSNAFGGNQS